MVVWGGVRSGGEQGRTEQSCAEERRRGTGDDWRIFKREETRMR